VSPSRFPLLHYSSDLWPTSIPSARLGSSPASLSFRLPFRAELTQTLAHLSRSILHGLFLLSRSCFLLLTLSLLLFPSNFISPDPNGRSKDWSLNWREGLWIAFSAGSLLKVYFLSRPHCCDRPQLTAVPSGFPFSRPPTPPSSPPRLSQPSPSSSLSSQHPATPPSPIPS
jgi:hypothetical protein